VVQSKQLQVQRKTPICNDIPSPGQASHLRIYLPEILELSIVISAMYHHCTATDI
jgi:hypothetical protein